MKASVFLELKTVKNMKMATVFNAKETIRQFQMSADITFCQVAKKLVAPTRVWNASSLLN